MASQSAILEQHLEKLAVTAPSPGSCRPANFTSPNSILPARRVPGNGLGLSVARFQFPLEGGGPVPKTLSRMTSLVFQSSAIVIAKGSRTSTIRAAEL